MAAPARTTTPTRSRATWINEGLSDFAQTLTGYVDATATVFDRGADSHLYCFQGFGTVQTPFNTNPRDCGGPENSLNLWGEGGNPNAVLADYGNAYSFMLFLYDRYGADFISRLHRDGELQGLASLDAALEAEGVRDLYQVIHDYQTMTLVDKIVGDSPSRDHPRRAEEPGDHAEPALDGQPGQPGRQRHPGRGAERCRLRAAAEGQRAVAARARPAVAVKFQGAQTLPPLPLAWTIVTNDPDRPGNPVLWSGNANNLDAAAVTSVTVPAADPTLRFLAKYGAEVGYDYGYVTVSTDGGATYTAHRRVTRPSTGRSARRSTARPTASSRTRTTCPRTPGRPSCSASATSATAASTRAACSIDDITVGGTLISDGSSLEPFDSPSEIQPDRRWTTGTSG